MQQAFIISSAQAYRLLRDHFNPSNEEFWCIALSAGKEVLKVSMIFRGTVDSCPVHPRDIFRFGCLANASALIISHNHPCGSHEPSESDIAITRQLVRLGQMMEMPILDHLILSPKGYLSFADTGLLSSNRKRAILPA